MTSNQTIVSLKEIGEQSESGDSQGEERSSNAKVSQNVVSKAGSKSSQAYNISISQCGNDAEAKSVPHVTMQIAKTESQKLFKSLQPHTSTPKLPARTSDLAQPDAGLTQRTSSGDSPSTPGGEGLGGSQQGAGISQQRAIYEFIKKLPNAKMAVHTDGQRHSHVQHSPSSSSNISQNQVFFRGPISEDTQSTPKTGGLTTEPRTLMDKKLVAKNFVSTRPMKNRSSVMEFFDVQSGGKKRISTAQQAKKSRQTLQGASGSPGKEPAQIRSRKLTNDESQNESSGGLDVIKEKGQDSIIESQPSSGRNNNSSEPQNSTNSNQQSGSGGGGKTMREGSDESLQQSRPSNSYGENQDTVSIASSRYYPQFQLNKGSSQEKTSQGTSFNQTRPSLYKPARSIKSIDQGFSQKDTHLKFS